MSSYEITEKINSWRCFDVRLRIEKDWLKDGRINNNEYSGLIADAVELQNRNKDTSLERL